MDEQVANAFEIPTVHCSYDELVATDALAEHPRNPNRHGAKQIKLLARLIGYHGWRCPITVSRRSGYVVRGHGRLLAAQHLRLAQVPVDYQDYADEQAEWADLVADNQIAELADLDADGLGEILRDLEQTNFDLELTGMDAEQLAALCYSSKADSEPAGPPTDLNVPPCWQVVCQCASETEQKALYERLTTEGVSCRLLIL